MSTSTCENSTTLTPSLARKRKTSNELIAELSQFTGTELWHRNPINSNMLYTDGVKFFADEGGEQGAYWFLDVVATEYFRLQRKDPFMVIDLAVKDSRATVVVTDGNDNIVINSKVDHTDMQEGSWRFYLTDNVMLLPSEY